MKTILVPTSGSESDVSVFSTALAAARSLGAHLCFFHVRLPAAAATLGTPLEFCPAPMVAEEFEVLKKRESAHAARALRHFESLCKGERIPVQEAPSRSNGVSASWLEETDEPEQRLLFHARHFDLIVLGRRHRADHLSERSIEHLLMESGRPLLLAPSAQVQSLNGTVVVGWKETAPSARALAASMPFLTQAKKVVLVGVAEAGEPTNCALEDCARQLLWHGIRAQVRLIEEGHRPVVRELTEAALGEGAELLVVGGFGRGPLRELVFGGVTQGLIVHADLPVLMAH